MNEGPLPPMSMEHRKAICMAAVCGASQDKGCTEESILALGTWADEARVTYGLLCLVLEGKLVVDTRDSTDPEKWTFRKSTPDERQIILQAAYSGKDKPC